jgi:hypothetical protein
MKKAQKISAHLYDAKFISATATTIHSEKDSSNSVTLISYVDLLPRPLNKTQFFSFVSISHFYYFEIDLLSFKIS